MSRTEQLAIQIQAVVSVRAVYDAHDIGDIRERRLN
jgi:hypothetical protein